MYIHDFKYIIMTLWCTWQAGLKWGAMQCCKWGHMENVAVHMNPRKVGIPHRETGINRGPCLTYWHLGMFHNKYCYFKYRGSRLNIRQLWDCLYLYFMMGIPILKKLTKNCWAFTGLRLYFGLILLIFNMAILLYTGVLPVLPIFYQQMSWVPVSFMTSDTGKRASLHWEGAAGSRYNWWYAALEQVQQVKSTTALSFNS